MRAQAEKSAMGLVSNVPIAPGLEPKSTTRVLLLNYGLNSLNLLSIDRHQTLKKQKIFYECTILPMAIFLGLGFFFGSNFISQINQM